GHTGGAAGAMAAVAAALMIRAGTVPGNVELGGQDPSCQVWLPSAATPLAGRYAMVNAYAFGGSNISLVLASAASRAGIRRRGRRAARGHGPDDRGGQLG